MAAQPLCEGPHVQCVRVKICGLTRVDEAVACVQAGADYLGLNLHPGSRRFVELSQAEQIIQAIDRQAQAVGLFVNRPASEVASVADQLGLKCIQLHGDEPTEDLEVLDRFWIIRAFRLGCVADIRAMTGYLERSERAGRTPDAVLVVLTSRVSWAGRQLLWRRTSWTTSLRCPAWSWPAV
jgi:phosphoribosylanthranilate isomerase